MTPGEIDEAIRDACTDLLVRMKAPHVGEATVDRWFRERFTGNQIVDAALHSFGNEQCERLKSRSHDAGSEIRIRKSAECRVALETFLGGAFDSQALKALTRHHEHLQSVTDHVAWDHSLADVVYRFVEVLEMHGLIDGALFEILKMERPKLIFHVSKTTAVCCV